MGLSAGVGSKKNVHLWAYGDSNTQGVYFGTGIPLSYATIIANTKGWELHNRGYGGAKLADAELSGRALSDTLNSYNYNVVVALLGYNDMRFYGNNSTAISNFGTLLSSMLTKWRDAGALVFVGNCLKMNVYNDVAQTPYINGSIAAVNAYNAEIASKVSQFSNAVLVDACTAFDPSAVGALQPDTVHPSGSGQQTIANSFISLLGVV